MAAPNPSLRILSISPGRIDPTSIRDWNSRSGGVGSSRAFADGVDSDSHEPEDQEAVSKKGIGRSMSPGKDRPEILLFDRRSFLAAWAGFSAGAAFVSSCAPIPKHWLILQGRKFTVGVDQDLALKVYRRDGALSWQTSTQRKPQAIVLSGGAQQEPIAVSFEEATAQTPVPFHQGRHTGYRIGLRSFAATDVALEAWTKGMTSFWYSSNPWQAVTV